jgi:hypothetical protein
MSKYEPLLEYLHERSEASVDLSFDELDRLIDGLPPSARVHPAWWANSRDAHAHTRYWLDAERIASPDFANQRVRFSTPTDSPKPQRAVRPSTEGRHAAATPTFRDGIEFERHAIEVLSRRWNVPFAPAIVELHGGVTKQFDLVSNDGRIVGDAKYYKNIATPAAKWSTIAEYVWLLQNVAAAERRFMVFGLHREVPTRWLQRFRPLIGDVEFWFLDGDDLELL